MNQDKAQAFGEYIKQRREERKLSIRSLATKAGINNGALSRIESGKRMPPKAGTLKALAEALEVPLTDVFAMAGHEIPYDLPAITPYLRARYGHLPDDALTSIDTYLKKIIDEYDLDLNGPADLEDEKSASQH
jgi:transcriptional regulator with XRE-family HTH domain